MKVFTMIFTFKKQDNTVKITNHKTHHIHIDPSIN